ncbi:MAG: M14 family metallopeptidase [Pseudomonadales bacterium]
MTVFHYIQNPDANAIVADAAEWLKLLAGPTCITVEGRDPQRTRAVVTLLHGNEPSGTLAVHRWLRSGIQPAVNMLFIIASVKAALIAPGYSHRVIPGQRDLNRCFRKPYDDEPGVLAHSILEELIKHRPECVVDMHNTSGSGPAFGVVTHMDERHDALTSLFTQRLVVTSLRLGALMEISEHLFPTVTIECGGRQDVEAHELAWEGLLRYSKEDNVLAPQDTDWGMEVLNNPVRLELAEGCRLAYGEQARPDVDLILRQDIEHLNFGLVEKATFLGWIGNKGLTIFSAINSKNDCVLDELLEVRDGRLYTAKSLKLFMITTSAEIAQMDCLLYAVLDDGKEIGLISG